MSALFAVTTFVGSFLLFLVQPMVARMLLPMVGGAAGVWNTCMLFFQFALLAGYFYSHWLPSRLGQKRHAYIHLVILVLPLLVLPISLQTTSEPPMGADPTWWLLRTLFGMVALPFFALATNAPLIQRWYSELKPDPTRLYAASNMGSLIALLGYPIMVEPCLSLTWQSRGWAVGYGFYLVLCIACVIVVYRTNSRQTATAQTTDHDAGAAIAAFSKPEGAMLHASEHSTEKRATWVVFSKWVVLAFLPSSLMLGLNAYLATDVASAPLLWVTPLAIYLGSFVLVFSRPSFDTKLLVAIFVPLAVLLFLFTAPHTAGGYLLVFFHIPLCAMGCVIFHKELVQTKPLSQHLSLYYLAMAVGGALGGVFNGLLAPLIFHRAIEYPMTMALALLCLPKAKVDDSTLRERRFLESVGVTPEAIKMPSLDEPKPRRRWDWGIPLGVAIVTTCFFLLPIFRAIPAVVRYGVPMVFVIFTSIGNRFRLGLGLLAIVLASHFDSSWLVEKRTYYGVLRIKEQHGVRRFLHGTTLHGEQSVDPAKSMLPSSYYDPRSPIGAFFTSMNSRLSGASIGVVGLGVGMMATHSQAGQNWTFMELDGAVVDLAKKHFTYLSKSAAYTDVIEGDARLVLQREKSWRFDVLLLDAFNSDAIPVHLVTKEALELYLNRINEHGVIGFHITNRYVHLAPVISKLAQHFNLVGYQGTSEIVVDDSVLRTSWVFLAKNQQDLAPLVEQSANWLLLQPAPSQSLWTDEHIDFVGALLNR